MSIEYTRDDSHRRIMLRLTSPVTSDEFRAVIDRQAAEGTWHYGVLYDARASTEPPSPEESERLLAYIRKVAAVHGQRGPIAIITRSTSAIGAAQMYAFRAEATMDVQIFWDKDDAERWLEQHLPPA